MLRCREREIAEPLPHPDDIILDMNTGRVVFKWPITKEDKAAWDDLRDRKRIFLNAIADGEAELDNNPDPEDKEIILEDIEQARRCLEIISKAIPD